MVNRRLETLEFGTLYWHTGRSPKDITGVLREGAYKMLVNRGKVELYNIEDDTSESTDIARDQPQRVDRMPGLWKTWNQSNQHRFGKKVKAARRKTLINMPTTNGLRAHFIIKLKTSKFAVGPDSRVTSTSEPVRIDGVTFSKVDSDSLIVKANTNRVADGGHFGCA